jgi:hypothetical protein
LNSLITFKNSLGLDNIYAPEPAIKNIPVWYKDLDSYIGGEKKPIMGNGTSPATIKRCMPVFDALSAGYIIKTSADVFVSQKNNLPYYEWAGSEVIQFHDLQQAPTHPNRNGLDAYPKWINPWSIKTKKGYSCLFVQPFHRESPFTILPGIVDTDKYFAPVNFPFTLNDPKFEGLIPAGTPVAQVIPFKRKIWSMKIDKSDNFTEIESASYYIKSKFFDAYKNKYRQNKEYK